MTVVWPPWVAVLQRPASGLQVLFVGFLVNQLFYSIASQKIHPVLEINTILVTILSTVKQAEFSLSSTIITKLILFCFVVYSSANPRY